jgi:hypothetical protein
LSDSSWPGYFGPAHAAQALAKIWARADYIKSLQENLKAQEAASEEVRTEFKALVEQRRTALRDHDEENGEVAILTAAFDDAWAKLQASRAPFAEQPHASAAREILAKQIIMAAQRGGRNPRHLARDALLPFWGQKLKQAA